MSVITNNLLLGDEGYFLTKSLRFRSSASAYLSRSAYPSSSATTWTFSFWMKLGTTPPVGDIFSFVSTTGSAQQCGIGFTDSGGAQIGFWQYAPATYQIRLIPSMVFRDPSAWYHVVVVYNSSNATASNRAQIYVNGVLQTAFTTATYPSLNLTSYFNNGSHYPYLGAQNRNNGFLNGFDGYLAEINFIDGQALTPSSFGETDPKTGVWIPKKYTGTYGTNGFYLDFKDTSSVAALGYDAAGSNDWTVNNVSLTSGATYDSMKDVPTLTDADTANYAVFNPLWRLGGSGYITPTNGNLRASIGGTNNIIASTIPLPTTGKWYMEFTLTTAVYPEFGLCNNSANGGGGASNIFGMYMSLWFANGSNGSHDGNVPNTSSDVGLIAVDVDNNKLWIGRNRSGTTVWMGGGNPSSGTSPSFSASGGGGVYATTFNAQTFNNPFVASGAGSDVWDANFGQQPWVGTPPSGFKALNTFNLPTPTIGATASSQANRYMDILTWTGTSTASGRTFTGLNFQPDFVWAKSRSGAYNHQLYDAVRGTGKRIQSNTTDAETTNPVNGYISAFNSDGFTTVAGTTDNSWFNELNTTYVGWNWRANGSSSTNTAGSITSTVSANTTAGFSIVTYTGTGANATVGHGLGVAPSMMIFKVRSTTNDWLVYHKSVGATGYLLLNTTAATATSALAFNNTAPTSSVFTISTGNAVNANTQTYVAYCFAEVAGYSAFGSYTGNGSTNGTFVYTGFRPRFVLFKRTDTTANWYVYDTTRKTFNAMNEWLAPNLSNAENSATTWEIDIVSNGFKMRNTGAFSNANGGTYIYAAFAESPFKYSLAR